MVVLIKFFCVIILSRRYYVFIEIIELYLVSSDFKSSLIGLIYLAAKSNTRSTKYVVIMI